MPKFQATLSLEVSGQEAAEAVISSVSALLHQMQVKAKVSEIVSGIKTEVVVVYTDGGCNLKKGVGAWAYTIQEPGKPIVEGAGPMLETTNNRMEMLAVIKALEALEIGLPILIHCDSEYVIKGVTQWSTNWKRNGWVNSMGKPVVNRDLWEHLLDLYDLHSVAFKHVKGHSGIEGNERVDELCTMMMLTVNPALGLIPVDNKSQIKS